MAEAIAFALGTHPEGLTHLNSVGTEEGLAFIEEIEASAAQGATRRQRTNLADLAKGGDDAGAYIQARRIADAATRRRK